jgi:lactate dehydrogenase-like 2-hydroxyacid dehydrogenase
LTFVEYFAIIFHMQTIKAAVVGVGHLGSIHARIYRELTTCSLAGVCDTDPSRLAQASKELKVPGYADYRQLLGKADAVSVCVPPCFIMRWRFCGPASTLLKTVYRDTAKRTRSK